ncbi:DUF1330 domain-containing protein [Kaistia algarum]|uniref:DUF1330 domain-containing protein n=1 Tax=Kaistia algarum TaxID=2083279 RepID=UPI00225BC4A3|nr:DUF1330 domain-containing protein [Kaistia algarum]MCX5515641.1 DUF1330 domain-containing protein [Kaistia algarum]
MREPYLSVTESQGRAFVARAIRGPVTMLDLLRFRAIADYSADPTLAPPTPISGAAAFSRYIAHTLPHLRRSGGSIVASYDGRAFLIGPEAERWDRVLLIRQASVDAFLAFARDEAYLAGLGHRTAALEDSRLLPLTESARVG